MAPRSYVRGLAVFLGFSLLQVSANALNLQREVESGIKIVKNPLDQTVTYVGSSQCENVKKIFGMSYDQMESNNEPDVESLVLELRTKHSSTRYKISEAKYALPQSKDYDFSKKLVVFIHGFFDDPSSNSFGSLCDAFLERGGFNVLALDGSSLIRLLYLRSSTYIRFMGEKLGETLVELRKGGLKPEDIHLIGHSLGSHISSFAGKTYFKLTGERIDRISGLDPAGPCFSNIDVDLRLKRGDAKFVDVMHTDGGVLGLKEAVGDVDFFVNGGETQPGCIIQVCSHLRSWMYYVESINNPDSFPAIRCNGWQGFKSGNCPKDQDPVYMGYSTPYGTTGRFYLRTSNEAPYGLGLEGLEYKGDDTIAGTISDALPNGQQVAGSKANPVVDKILSESGKQFTEVITKGLPSGRDLGKSFGIFR